MGSPYDPRITAYFGDAVLQAGFVPLPHLFLRHYRKLGLSQIQAMFMLQLMEIAWDIGDPPSSVNKLAERMGVGHRTIQVCSREVHELGLVEIYDQFDATGAQVENGYDLSPLFKRLAALAPPSRPAGQQRTRRIRTAAPTADAGTNTLHVMASDASSASPAQTLASVPVQDPALPPLRNPTPVPRDYDHRPPDQQCTGAWQNDSGLKVEPKNKDKKHTKKTQKHQVVGGGLFSEPAGCMPQRSIPRHGRSLRWDTPLGSEQIASSRQTLNRIGLNAVVAEQIEATLHPAEVWALWCYARGAGLGPGWIASQCFDFKRKRPQPAGLAGRYDDAGRLLAQLLISEAEFVLDIIDERCPKSPDLLVSDPRLRNAKPIMRAAAAAVWAVMSEQRHGGPLHEQIGNAPPLLAAGPDPVWETTCARLAKVVSPTDWSTWIEPLTLLDIADDTVVIGAPNCFARDHVRTTYDGLLEEAFQTTLGRMVHVEVVIGSTTLSES